MARTANLSKGPNYWNQERAGRLIAIETVAKAQPDGYTLLLYGSTIFAPAKTPATYIAETSRGPTRQLAAPPLVASAVLMQHYPHQWSTLALAALRPRFA